MDHGFQVALTHILALAPQSDHVQMNNLISSLNEDVNTAYFKAETSQSLRIASRMDALLLYLKSCKGVGCRFSWNHLFPYGEVTSLYQALDSKYDEYFDRLPKVELQGCDNGYRRKLTPEPSLPDRTYAQD